MLGRLLRAQGMRRGVLGGSRAWTVLWALVVSARIVRRLTADKPKVLLAETLAPGEVLVISNEHRSDTAR